MNDKQRIWIFTSTYGHFPYTNSQFLLTLFAYFKAQVESTADKSSLEEN